MSVAALMVSVAVPDDVNVTDCVAGVFRLTLPKAIVVEATVRPGVPGATCRAKVFVPPPAVAVRVAVCVVVTVETVAVNAALVDPADTVTEAGTVTALLLLVSVTASPPDAAADVRLTVQASVPAPVIELLVQETAFSVPLVDCPVPLRLITAVPLVEELLVIVSEPLAAPAVVGSKVTVNVTFCPGVRVTGKLAPETLNPAPVTAAALMVTEAVPEEVSVTD